MYADRPGEFLPNGSMIVALREIERVDYDDTTRHKQLVLAIRGPNYGEPFVTWSRWVTHKKGDSKVIVADDCAWGHYSRTIDEALADFNSRVEEATHEQANKKALHSRGFQDGENAASWLIDGNTPDPKRVIDRLMQGWNDGDPEILDQLPVPRYGGEFADEPTWEDILKAELDEYTDENIFNGVYDDLQGEYDNGFHEGVEKWLRDQHTIYSAKE